MIPERNENATDRVFQVMIEVIEANAIYGGRCKLQQKSCHKIQGAGTAMKVLRYIAGNRLVWRLTHQPLRRMKRKVGRRQDALVKECSACEA